MNRPPVLKNQNRRAKGNPVRAALYTSYANSNSPKQNSSESERLYSAAASFPGMKYTSSNMEPFCQPARESMPWPFSHMLGWPQRYPVVSVGLSPHSATYFRTRSSTRPVSPFQAASSHGRLMVATNLNQGTSAAIFSNSSR